MTPVQIKTSGHRMAALSGAGLGLAALLFALSACGPNPNGTTLQSAPFSGTSGARLAGAFGQPGSINPNPLVQGLVTVTDVQLCITQLKLESEAGEAIKGSDGQDGIEAKVGLLDLGDGSTTKTWGVPTLPEGTAISKIKVEVHHDPEICGGATFSASLNGNEITQDVEMVFRFATPQTVVKGDAVTLALGSLVTAFATALDAGQFSDAQIGNYIQGIEETAEHEKH